MVRKGIKLREDNPKREIPPDAPIIDVSGVIKRPPMAKQDLTDNLNLVIVDSDMCKWNIH